MDPRLQFVAVASLVALYLPLALAIYRRADALGLFAEPQKRVSEPPVERIRPLPAAAE
jgi:hypothetical protein